MDAAGVSGEAPGRPSSATRRPPLNGHMFGGEGIPDPASVATRPAPRALATDGPRGPAGNGRARGRRPGRRKARAVEEILARLGSPADEGSLREPWGNETWELRVPCSRGFSNWDVFFYRPTEVYPVHADGGDLEPIGTWAYVNE